MKRIMVVYNRLNLGGIQVKIIDILSKLLERGDGEILLVLRRAEGEFLQEVPDRVTIKNLNLGKSLFDALMMVIKLGLIINKYQPKKILTFADHTSSLVLLAKLILVKKDLPVIVSEGILLSRYLNCQPASGLRRLLVTFLYPKAQKIIVLTKAIKEDLIRNFGLPSQNITIINNWISPKFTASDISITQAKKTIDLLFAGRLESQKNLFTFIDIVKFLTESLDVDIQAVIVGTGSQEEELKKYSRFCGMSKKIDFVGFCHNPLEYYVNSKIFLLTSEYEGQPHSIIEAMWAGLPIVAKSSPGLKELVRQNKTGFLFSDNDEAAQIIHRLLSNEPLRRRLGKRGHEIVKHKFSTKNLDKILAYLMSE